MYKVGLYVSEELDAAIASASRLTKNTMHLDFSTAMSSHLSVESMESRVSNEHGKVSAALLLKFLMKVGTDKLVDAIVTSLDNDPTASQSFRASVASFKSILVTAIGTNGVVSNDEIEFLFMSFGNRIEVVVRGQSAGSIQDNDLQKKLLDIYTAKGTVVTPDVFTCLNMRYI